MDKRYILFLVIGLFILAITGCSKKSSVVYIKNDTSLMDNSFSVEKDYYDNYDATLEDIEYNLESLSEYVKYFHFILNYEESYTSLSDEEKAAVIAYASGLSYPQSIDHVKMVAKRYFDLDDYELPVGKYSVVGSGDLGNEEWSIERDEDFYKSSIVPRGLDVNRTIDFYDFINNQNEIILKGKYYEENVPTNPSYECSFDDESMNEGCIKGYYEYKLEKVGSSLILQSIKYTINKDYDKNAKVSIFGA